MKDVFHFFLASARTATMHDMPVPTRTMRLRLSRDLDCTARPGPGGYGKVGTSEAEPATLPVFREAQPTEQFPDLQPHEETGSFVRGFIIASAFGVLVYAAIAWFLLR